MIRPIEENDISSCLEIYNWYIENSVATFEETKLSLSQFQQRVHRICEKYPYIVLEENHKIIGYAYLDAFHERSAYQWTVDLSIYLDHTLKLKGYGSLLMEAILLEADKHGFYHVVSIVTEGNTASEKIHVKFGFEKEGFLKQVGYKHETWLGVSYYVKQIKQTS